LVDCHASLATKKEVAMTPFFDVKTLIGEYRGVEAGF